MKLDPFVGMGIGAVAGAALYALLLQPEKPCAVVWAGPLTTKSDQIVSMLANNGFTINGGTLKQDVVGGTTVFMVKPSDLANATRLIAAIK